jgi:hypothetical protein
VERLSKEMWRTYGHRVMVDIFFIFNSYGSYLFGFESTILGKEIVAVALSKDGQHQINNRTVTLRARSH